MRANPYLITLHAHNTHEHTLTNKQCLLPPKQSRENDGRLLKGPGRPTDTVSLVSGTDLSSSLDILDGAVVHPLYASLPSSAQSAAFQPLQAGCVRRIIVSTNIAETSVTLPDVVFVVDSGVEKVKGIEATGVGYLKTQVITKASARQRAGRCGRTRPGMALRLYTEPDYLAMEEEVRGVDSCDDDMCVRQGV